jgi:putative toxin-antitoxin system antitoxin component (TIGR02293 family)
MADPALKIAAILGGVAVLHRKVRSELDLVNAVKEGLPTGAVEQMVDRQLLSKDEVYQFIAPKRTYLHRRQRQHALTQEESERVTRLARIFALAEEAFQSSKKAGVWLRQPSRVLGTAPLELLATEPGARLVEEELLRINWGLYA